MRRRFVLAACVLALGTGQVWADAPKTPGATKSALPTGTLAATDWLKPHTAPLQPGEIDRLIDAELKKVNFQPTPLITDEQFVRRVYLDLTGHLPMPADISEFLAQKNPSKRAHLIDKLLASEDFAKHWAQYWRNVITSRITDPRGQVSADHFQRWLELQFQQNRSWGEITRDIIKASGTLKFDEPEKNGQAFFMTSRMGADAQTELAAETSRIFLGIQIQCAQCHDHPSDVWKRQNFHEFAAYFARVRQRPVRDGMRITGIEVVSVPFGEYQMPGKDDPKKTTSVQPRFLDGKGPGPRLGDLPRRQSLAQAITATDNPWFAGAFVNRTWGELLGQSFYQPIDDMGPEKEAVMPEVLARVAASFRGSNYDVKQLFRDITSSQAYQRQMRPGESSESQKLFGANNPTRLQADALWQSLVDTLGQLAGPRPNFGGKPPPPGPFGRFQSFEFLFKQEFSFDPSTRPEEVEGSISQALLLMNNPVLNQKMKAQGNNLLARILQSYPQDDDAVRMVYLRTLARRPTDRELARCRDHISAIANRAEAFEDILWALINSTEYQTKR